MVRGYPVFVSAVLASGLKIVSKPGHALSCLWIRGSCLLPAALEFLAQQDSGSVHQDEKSQQDHDGGRGPLDKGPFR